MKSFKLVWDGMNGLTYTVKAENVKEAKIVLADRKEIYDIREIKCVGWSRISEAQAV